MKQCTGPSHIGERLLPLSAFNRDAHLLDGFATRCRACTKAAGQARRDANRDAVFGHYGRVCACPGCGATERLSIDHIHGGGNAHRVELGIKTSDGFYVYLIAQGFPEGYQTLCLPCNDSKAEGPACRLWHGDPAYQRCTGPDHIGERVLPLDQFGPDARRGNGRRQPRCLRCEAIRHTTRRARKKNPPRPGLAQAPELLS